MCVVCVTQRSAAVPAPEHACQPAPRTAHRWNGPRLNERDVYHIMLSHMNGRPQVGGVKHDGRVLGFASLTAVGDLQFVILSMLSVRCETWSMQQSAVVVLPAHAPACETVPRACQTFALL